MANLKIANKTVLVLVDFFLPVQNLTPTLEILTKNKNKIIVVSDFGRETLDLHAAALAEAMKRKFIVLKKNINKLPEYDIPHMYFASDTKLLSQMRSGDIVVVENLNLLSRFETNELSKLAEVFVNDAFGADESLIKMLAQNLSKQEGLESLRQKKSLDLFLSRSKKPLILVLGGVDFSGKEAVLDNMMHKAEIVLVGGAIANLFLKIQGLEIGKSVIDNQADEKAVKKLLRDYRSKIKLPLDVVVATSSSTKIECVRPQQIKAHQRILDIGPQTTLEFSKFIKQGKTLVWSGALGRVEEKKFAHGTSALLRLFASRCAKGHVVAAACGETILPMLALEGSLTLLDVAQPKSLTLLKVLSQ
ncbi:MAG: phosphoglycerate kinase [Candidatus Doudnabacteria bacterium RIFCSPHIGHO2_01_FULL_46_14]|uniref:Phosphoglycerate kinase n=1 Tax=Candidatus Doudnabacteria bacterium RIFCSPHIGHO2_01_FULL_46_14 TaxID=1817824 RepID=A0A1F5NLP5_9BACT|nr:MAG: phosphoglycerate kinase [Candidatus Doudnabacteria bacterium RIFCSPHIGHO2_01_FULL_46_14]